MRFTLMGFHNYDPHLWDAMEVPTGIDKTKFIEELLYRCGDLYTYYQVPARIKESITRWSKLRKPSFQRMVDALAAEYNPIENYDRTHEGERHDRAASSGSGTNSASGTTEGQKSAYNSSSYEPDSKAILNSSGSDTTAAQSMDDVFDYSRDHGNVGVTTNQQMIEAELELRKRDIYAYMCKEFEDYFLIRVY